MIQAPFSIYNASAGSGKTFTLVKTYLTLLLSSSKPDYFKNILAITFTNKAVGEMKQRIMENLFAFSENKVTEKYKTMFDLICKETGTNERELKERAQNTIVYILHNYSYFDVETIDRFNHRLIRTFARDLKLSANFEVELDIDLLLSEAIDKVISHVGTDKMLTKSILEFSFEKTDNDKSWDITLDLKNISSILKSENDLTHFEKLKDKTLVDFFNLKNTLFSLKTQYQNQLHQLSNEFFDVLSKNNLDVSDFNGKYLPNYFQKIANHNFNVLTGAKWQQNFNSVPLYPKRVNTSTASTIDSLKQKFVKLFEDSVSLVLNLDFINTLMQNVNSLSLINAVYNEYLNIQEEKNLLPISEFNTRINNEIKNQPAPFIYERLGDKYRHFFIDEFQDTSEMQWENLIPLIENALSQTDEKGNSGSLLLVGDAKQSIYRWRGGNPDQFIKLYEKYNPFESAEKKVKTLDTNFRSFEEIIKFNNLFFNYVSQSFTSTLHSQLYVIGNNQKSTNKNGGYVSLEFLDPNSETDKNTVYQKKTLEIIKSLIEKNYSLKDISILVRKNSQGIALAEYLSENNIKIISSEALLLESAPEINFVLDVLRTIQNFEDKKSRANIFYFLHAHLNIDQPHSDFLNEMLGLTKSEISKKLDIYDIQFNIDISSGTPLFELCDNICQTFSLSSKRVAYIQSFLELVFDYTSKNSNTIASFLEYWEEKKSNRSVVISDLIDAVRIMTIHKSKGLEFPVVIYPFADDDIISTKGKKIWLPINEQEFNGFTELLVPAKKELENYGENAQELYNKFKMQSELDTINIVYVAMTRAVEHLYVLTDFNSIEKENRTASLFYQFLKANEKWDVEKLKYEFGDSEIVSTKESLSLKNIPITLDKFPNKNNYHNILKIATKKALLWNTNKEKAIEKGDLLHDILTEIKTIQDKDPVLQNFIQNGTISKEQSFELDHVLTSLLSHSKLKDYFSLNNKSVNEIEIYTENGESLRPDRINFTGDNTVTIIDYKTGTKKTEHIKQIKSYAEVLLSMGFNIHELLLAYISEKHEVIVVNNPS